MASPLQESWRLLTIAFVDLVGSTPLSLVLDGDDYAEVITSYWETVMPIVTQHGGFPASEEGDGRLVWFGWPHVTRSDADRAVRMALDVRRAVRTLATTYRDRLGIDLSVRLGIHTGEIIVRTEGGEPPVLIGATANVAAKVQAASPADSVCISEATAALVSDRFALKPSGSLTIDGLKGELAIFRVEDERSAETAEVNHVGRRHEHEMLRGFWQEVVLGRSATVLIVGEAGIGKSQLANNFLSHEVEVSQLLLIQGDSYRQDESWGALLEGLERSSLGAAMKPDAGHRDEFMDTIIESLEEVAADGPAVVLVEDAQWLDHSSAEFVSRVIRAEVAGLFVLATSRLTATAMEPIGSVRTLTLGPLSSHDVTSLVLASAPSLESGVVADIVARSGGNPLFAEVLTVAAEDPVAGDQHPALLPHSEVPIVVQQAMRTQLEASQAAADLSSTAAVIGIEFTADLLEAAHPLPVDIDAELAWLESAGVIRETEPEGAYRFRHALVQQLAYDLLVRRSRQLRHGRVADALRELRTAGPTVLGMHYERAGRYEEAAQAKVQAALDARAAGAFREGVDLVNQVLDLLESSVSVDRRDLEVQALELRAVLTAAFHRSGYVAGELDRDRLASLLKAGSDDAAMIRVLTREWAGSIVMSDLRGAGAALRRMSRLVGDDQIARVMIRQFRGTNMMYRGNFAYAEPMLREAAQTLAELGLRPEFRANWSTADDPVSVSISRLPPLLWVRGEFTDALEMLRLAETEAATIAGPAAAMNVAHVKANSALFHEQIGDGREAMRIGQEIVEIGREPALAFWERIGKLHQLIGSVILEPDENQVDELLESARQLESSARLFAPMVYLVAAQGYLAVGRQDGALVSAKGAQLIADETGARWLWPETQRLRARALADDDMAVSLLEEAATVAARQGARIYELRALLDLLARDRSDPALPSGLRSRMDALADEFPETAAYPELEQLRELVR